MIDERFINTFGIVTYELKGACNFGFHFIIVCDTVKRAFRLLCDAKAQCSVEIIDKLITINVELIK